LDVSRPNAFLKTFLPFQARVTPLGVYNSLVQTTLKLTLPGMPDFYQGAELWDLSLVDPDNRRPVDYETRTELLWQVATSLRRNRCAAMREMLEKWRDGRIKLAVIATLLACRRARPALFRQGGYEPLSATGDRADQICAFARCEQENAMIVVATRFPARCERERDWSGTEIAWPQAVECDAVWQDIFTGRVVETSGESVDVGTVLEDLPVAVLVTDNGNDLW
jgi:(1->4)-alpha-D-glucan 1-alpha-D-glucosylmutase